MIPFQCGMIWILSFVLFWVQFSDAESTLCYSKNVETSQSSVEKPSTQKDSAIKGDDVVKVQLYYESLCPYSRRFVVGDLYQAMKKLGDRIDLHSYPYGNAQTIVHRDGTYDFVCQHGPKECYGNMLHACALNAVKNHTAAFNFIVCLMDLNETAGSDDKMADKCGKKLNIDSEAIKRCAKGRRGKQLHKCYGKRSEKVDYSGVPYVLINGEPFQYTDFFQEVCDAFKNPPKACDE